MWWLFALTLNMQLTKFHMDIYLFWWGWHFVWTSRFDVCVCGCAGMHRHHLQFTFSNIQQLCFCYWSPPTSMFYSIRLYDMKWSDVKVALRMLLLCRFASFRYTSVGTATLLIHLLFLFSSNKLNLFHCGKIELRRAINLCQPFADTV